MMRYLSVPVGVLLVALPAMGHFGGEEKKGTKSSQKKPPKISVAQEKLKNLHRQRREMYFQQYKIRRKIERSKAAIKMRAALTQAKKVYDDAVKAKMSELKGKEAPAKKALQELIAKRLVSSKEFTGLQQKDAGQQTQIAGLRFQIALAELHLNHAFSPIALKLADDPELKKLRGNWVKYNNARKEKFAAMPEVKKRRAEIAGARKEIAALEKSRRELRIKINKRQHKIEHAKDEELATARKKYDQARRAVFAVYREKDIRELSAKVRKAQLDVRKAIDEFVKNNPEYAALRRKMQQLDRDIQKLELDQRIRQLQKQKEKLKEKN